MYLLAQAFHLFAKMPFPIWPAVCLYFLKTFFFSGNEEPTPGNSYIEFDINKHTTDLLGLYRYVAAKVHRNSFAGGWADLEIPR